MYMYMHCCTHVPTHPSPNMFNTDLLVYRAYYVYLYRLDFLFDNNFHVYFFRFYFSLP